MRADLHIHSIHSDGNKKLNELISLAMNNNIDIIGITDHDSINIINEITKKEPIKVIIGTEYSTYHNNENIHLLGYYKNNKPNNNVTNYLNALKGNREARAKEILKKLDEIYNIKLDYNELLSISNGSIGRPHIAELITKYYNIARDEIFDTMIGNDSPCYIKTTNLSLTDAIDFLHNNNAIAVLAHPIYYKKTSIQEFINLGIDGIECFYPDHGKKYSKKLVKLCNDNNLLITGGSDYHNDYSYYKIGYSNIVDDNIRKILERLEIK